MSDSSQAHDSSERPAPDETPAPGDSTLPPKSAREIERGRAEAQAAVVAILRRDQRGVVEHLASERRDRHARRAGALALLALMLLDAWVWLGNPAWIEFSSPPPLPPEYLDASRRVAVFFESQRIVAWARDNGALPGNARAAGPVPEGVSYRPIGPAYFALSAGQGADRVVYRSTGPARAFAEAGLRSRGILAGGPR